MRQNYTKKWVHFMSSGSSELKTAYWMGKKLTYTGYIEKIYGPDATYMYVFFLFKMLS